MKATQVRNAAALAALLALGACSGEASFDINGQLVDSVNNLKPLANAGLVLTTNGQRVEVPVGATSFKFPDSITYGTEYSITVLQNPRHMTCSMGQGASGTAGRTETILAKVVCNQNSYAIGGTVTGLGAGTLVLINGGDQLTISVAANNLSFTMPSPVLDGAAYGVTVLTQPAGQKCTVDKGSDVMGESDRKNIAVTCVNTPA